MRFPRAGLRGCSRGIAAHAKKPLAASGKGRADYDERDGIGDSAAVEFDKEEQGEPEADYQREEPGTEPLDGGADQHRGNEEEKGGILIENRREEQTHCECRQRGDESDAISKIWMPGGGRRVLRQFCGELVILLLVRHCIFWAGSLSEGLRDWRDRRTRDTTDRRRTPSAREYPISVTRARTIQRDGGNSCATGGIRRVPAA